MKNILCTITLTGVLLTTSFSPTWGWDGSPQENLNNTEDNFLCLQPAMMQPSTAAKVLCAIARARESLYNKAFAHATHDLHRARTLIDLIKYAGPMTRVKDQLWEVKKNLGYESSEKIALDLIPIDLALTNLAYFVPVVEAKAHLHAAHTSLHNKDKVSAKAHLEALNNALVYTEGVLPLRATERHIAQAQELLAHNNIRQADVVLENAEAGIELISLRVDVVPIEQARKSFGHSMDIHPVATVEGKRTGLKQAGVWLTRHVQTGDREVTTEATAMTGMVGPLTEESGQKGRAVKPALQDLWSKTTAPAAGDATQPVVGWQTLRKYNTTNLPRITKLKIDLTDANFYLTYTEIFEFITHEDHKAQTAIEKAQTHLKAAEKSADGWLKGNIQAIQQESNLIHKELMNDQQSNMIRYAKVKTDVQQLLRELSW
ncbi:YfdX family protein [uncultured Nitrospira sp.]|uniref:YfdX family protein n=1 Tax=uncultured Nitrospira sp. TaxID=157176 RepID=UPI00314009D1